MWWSNEVNVCIKRISHRKWQVVSDKNNLQCQLLVLNNLNFFEMSEFLVPSSKIEMFFLGIKSIQIRNSS